MGESVLVPCLHCGEEIEFEVESWADPPERAFCGESCYEAHEVAPTAATPSAN